MDSTIANTPHHARYPYYLCPTRGCASYGKSIKRDVLEGEFEGLLQILKPTESLFNLARMTFEDLWNHRLNTQKIRVQSLTIEIDKNIEQLLDRVVASDSPSVIRAYDNRITDLEVQKMEL